MNVLLVGSGGREHALAWKLAQSPLLEKLLIAPGNTGTAQIGHNVPVDAGATDLLIDVARRERVGLVIVGSTAQLVVGLADACVASGIPVFGPSAAAARIESSNIFARRLMEQANVPSSMAHVFDDAAAAAAFVRASRCPWVVKADDLIDDRGVVVAEDVEATVAAIERIMAARPGARILLEQRPAGPELAVMALCDGTTLLPLPPARTYKRLRDGDTGPHTGGMGAYAPVPQLDDETLVETVEWHLRPIIRALAEAGTPFRGALYASLALTERGPQVLGLKASFGDPETQTILPLVEGDLLAALLACAEGALDRNILGQHAGTTASVVLAAAGYPEAPRRGDRIEGVEALDEPGALLLHGDTAWQDGGLVTAGGRPLCVTGMGSRLEGALGRAYEVVEGISFPGMQYRHDIGQ